MVTISQVGDVDVWDFTVNSVDVKENLYVAKPYRPCQIMLKYNAMFNG
jgi:hypothetical protein